MTTTFDGCYHCGHNAAKHNRVEGCPFCRCGATPAEGRRDPSGRYLDLEEREDTAAPMHAWQEKRTEYVWDAGKTSTGQACLECRTPYDACTKQVMTGKGACCRRCRYTDTHDEREFFPEPPPPESDHTECRKQLALAWSSYLSMMMDMEIEGRSVMRLVLDENPALRERLRRALS